MYRLKQNEKIFTHTWKMSLVALSKGVGTPGKEAKQLKESLKVYP